MATIGPFVVDSATGLINLRFDFVRETSKKWNLRKYGHA